jgi:hypothetical protein
MILQSLPFYTVGLMLLSILNLMVTATVAQPKRAGSETIGEPKRMTPDKAVEEKVKTVVVPLRQGYLALLTTPRAQITLTRVDGRGHERLAAQADDKGWCTRNIPHPGTYRIDISLEDYRPIAGTLTVLSGRPTGLEEKLTSNFGTLVLAMGEQAGSDVMIKLNDKPISAEATRIDGGKIYVSRVPVGKNEIKINKTAYDEWPGAVDVKPGDDSANTVVVSMKRATIALTVIGAPGANVFIDSIDNGKIGPNRQSRIVNLEQGEHKLEVTLDGYVTVNRTVRLTLEEREHKELVSLTPIPDDDPVDVTFDKDSQYWLPQLPSGWRIDKPGSVLVEGDSVGLVSIRSRKPGRDFNIYSDFLLKMNVTFVNGKGAAWVVRALDASNYYLFELKISGVSNDNALCFYVCQEGVCKNYAGCRSVPDYLGRKDESFQVQLKASGNKFSHTIVSKSNPRSENLGGEFVDSSFARGGIGLRGFNGSQALFREFYIEAPKATQ